jgi:DNA-directed RNA polymerase II subunit RPB1
MISERWFKALEDVMVCYDSTVRNSLGDLIQFNYGEDGMDGAFIEKQSIETFGLSNKEFEHNYCVDVTDPAGGFMENVLQAGVDDSSLELQAKLDKEYGRLIQVDDRNFYGSLYFPVFLPHSLIFFPSICTISCKTQSKFSISIAENQVTLSLHTL